MDFFKQKLLFAPMAGISESVFRTLCKENGADLVVSEMVSADGVYYNSKNTKNLLYVHAGERPIGIQLFGSNPQHIAYAAQFIEETIHPDFIDLNCGCPVPKVVKKNGGAALLKTPKLYQEIISCLVKAISIPVTVKIRSAWSGNDWVDIEYAKIAQDCGVCAITLHPRSRAMGFSGSALWERIALVKNAVSIPVIGNGDITSPQQGLAMVSQTGCDSIMIGRGALGNPWIFNQIKQVRGSNTFLPVKIHDIITLAEHHLHQYIQRYGTEKASRDMKKHIVWYLRRLPNAKKIRNSIFQSNSIHFLFEILQTLRSSHYSELE